MGNMSTFLDTIGPLLVVALIVVVVLAFLLTFAKVAGVANMNLIARIHQNAAGRLRIQNPSLARQNRAARVRPTPRPTNPAGKPLPNGNGYTFPEDQAAYGMPADSSVKVGFREAGFLRSTMYVFDKKTAPSEVNLDRRHIPGSIEPGSIRVNVDAKEIGGSDLTEEQLIEFGNLGALLDALGAQNGSRNLGPGQSLTIRYTPPRPAA